MLTGDLWADLKEALDHRTHPFFHEVDDGSLLGGMGCEVDGSAFDDSPSLFLVQVSPGFNKGTGLSWGFRSTTFRLRTVWLTEEPSHPACPNCGCHHDPKLPCPEEPIEELVVTIDQLIPAVMTEIDKVLEEYADPYASQPVEQADMALLMEYLQARWYRERGAIEDGYTYGVPGAPYEPLLWWSLNREIAGGKNTLTWVETRAGTEIEVLKLSAYQEGNKWRIDFHFDDFGERKAYEPYQFEDQVGHLPAAVVRCHCCLPAPTVKPDVFTLRAARTRIWEDIEIRVQTRRDTSFS